MKQQFMSTSVSTTQRARMWFPIAERHFREHMGVVDFRDCLIASIRKILGERADAHIARLGLGRFIFALKTENIDLAQSLLEVSFFNKSLFDHQFSSLCPVAGYAIPTDRLGQKWKYDREIGMPELLAIAVRIAQKIKHRVGFDASPDTYSPSIALEIGYGQCFDRASNVVAAYRLNGIPARVVGIEHFFEGDDPQISSHWFVEATIDGRHVFVDSTYDSFFLEMIQREATRRKFSDSEFCAFLYEVMEAANTRDMPVDQINSKNGISKRDQLIVAAEIDIPELKP